jgi:putative membrane protein
MNLTRHLPAVAIVVAAWTVPALAEDSAQTFVDKAAVAGTFEVESSELAIKMSKDPDVREFADMMIADHGKANAELETLAKQEGLAVPAELDEEHAALLKTLERAGDQFDTQYIKAQLDGHEAAVDLFKNYADSGENKALQNFAVETQPTLRTHLEKIEEMGNRVGATK